MKKTQSSEDDFIYWIIYSKKKIHITYIYIYIYIYIERERERERDLLRDRVDTLALWYKRTIIRIVRDDINDVKSTTDV